MDKETDRVMDEWVNRRMDRDRQSHGQRLTGMDKETEGQTKKMTEGWIKRDTE